MFGLPLQMREALPDSKLQGQLARFPRRLRKRVRMAAFEHGYLADLAFTFPMALFAIAANSRGRDVTERARALVLDGARLRAVSHELDLALWLRKLPPEALIEHVPRVPGDIGFTRHVVNFMPKDPKRMGVWLYLIEVAIQSHSEAFALWIGAALNGRATPSTPDGVGLLAAYAWHSARPSSEAGQWIKTPWRADMGLSDAVSAADSWLSRLQFASQKPAPLVAALPPRDNSVGQYHFHRLAWGSDIIREAEKMKNCLETYASDLNDGSQVWSIRSGEQSVADLEISFEDGGRGMPHLVQLYAPNNDPAPDAVWRAAYRWLGRWKLTAKPVAVQSQPSTIDQECWEQLWQPYWQHKADANVFPKDASNLGEYWLSNQSSHLWELSRLNKIES